MDIAISIFTDVRDLALSFKLVCSDDRNGPSLVLVFQYSVINILIGFPNCERRWPEDRFP